VSDLNLTGLFSTETELVDPRPANETDPTALSFWLQFLLGTLGEGGSARDPEKLRGEVKALEIFRVKTLADNHALDHRQVFAQIITNALASGLVAPVRNIPFADPEVASLPEGNPRLKHIAKQISDLKRLKADPLFAQLLGNKDSRPSISSCESAYWDVDGNIRSREEIDRALSVIGPGADPFGQLIEYAQRLRGAETERQGTAVKRIDVTSGARQAYLALRGCLKFQDSRELRPTFTHIVCEIFTKAPVENDYSRQAQVWDRP